MTIQPASRPTSPLRRCMLEGITMRGLREATQRDCAGLEDSGPQEPAQAKAWGRKDRDATRVLKIFIDAYS